MLLLAPPLVVALARVRYAPSRGSAPQDEARTSTEQRQRAEDEAQKATDQAQLARSRELMASAVAARDRDPSLSKLLAIEALSFEGAPTYQSTSVLHQVLAADPVVARYTWPDDQDVGWLWTDIDPTGKLLVASGTKWAASNHLEVADARSGKVLWSYPDHDLGVSIGSSYFRRTASW